MQQFDPTQEAPRDAVQPQDAIQRVVFKFNRDLSTLTYDGQRIHLTGKELGVLTFLVERNQAYPGSAVSKEMILKKYLVWNGDDNYW